MRLLRPEAWGSADHSLEAMWGGQLMFIGAWKAFLVFVEVLKVYESIYPFLVDSCERVVRATAAKKTNMNSSLGVVLISVPGVHTRGSYESHFAPL